MRRATVTIPDGLEKALVASAEALAEQQVAAEQAP